MGDVENEKMSSQARDVVAGQRPAQGENRVQLAMRRYLGAVGLGSLGKDQELGKKSDLKP